MAMEAKLPVEVLKQHRRLRCDGARVCCPLCFELAPWTVAVKKCNIACNSAHWKSVKLVSPITPKLMYATLPGAGPWGSGSGFRDTIKLFWDPTSFFFSSDLFPSHIPIDEEQTQECSYTDQDDTKDGSGKMNYGRYLVKIQLAANNDVGWLCGSVWCWLPSQSLYIIV